MDMDYEGAAELPGWDAGDLALLNLAFGLAGTGVPIRLLSGCLP
jgi:hypothetical protein